MSVYLDNSATTKMCPSAVKAMMFALEECYGNPSSLHAIGTAAHKALEDSRKSVANALSCSEQEIYFTSGATESNNMAILGAAFSLSHFGNRIVTSALEHPSVEQTMKYLESKGFEVVYIKPDNSGHISEDDLFKYIDKNTILVSMMLVNNEVGSILPVQKIRSAVKRAKSPALIHCDAVQAFGKIPVKPSALGVDLLSVSAHKMHGPKGVGALYIKKGVRLTPTNFGGNQENKIRNGTQPMPAILGFGAACDELNNIDENLSRVTAVRDLLLNKLSSLEGVTINSPDDALPYIINISLKGIRSEVAVNFLSDKGIYVSSGSACSKGHRSKVLTAMEISPENIDCALRISFSRYTTEDDINELILAITEAQKKFVK